jgi:ABC-type transporter lipoprotein component MlaA
MAVVQDEILDAFITELRERALSEFRRIEKENQDRYERVRELSMKLRDILSKFSEKNRQQSKVTWRKKTASPVTSLTTSTCKA